MANFIAVSLMVTLIFEPVLMGNNDTDRTGLPHQRKPLDGVSNKTHSSSKSLLASDTSREKGALEGIVLFEQFLADEKVKLFSPSLDNEDARVRVDGYPETLRNCSSNIKYVIEAARRGLPWALNMLDSMGKPSSGVLRQNYLFLGDFDQCMDVDTGVDFEGQYCRASLLISEIKNTKLATELTFMLGLCFPSSCEDDDVKTSINAYFQSHPDISAIALHASCQQRHLPLTTKATVVICICTILVTLLVIGTLYDAVYKRWLSKPEECPTTSNGQDHLVVNEYKDAAPGEAGTEYELLRKSKLQESENYPNNETVETEESSTFSRVCDKVLMSFSVYNNTIKLFTINKSQETIGCIHGMRFISTTWIILIHAHRMGAGIFGSLVPYLDKVLDDWTYMAVIKGVIAVDTFFALSGLLLTFLALKKLTKESPTLKFFGNFYFHRYLRVTVPYMLILMTYAPLFKYLSDGPLWPQSGIDVNECEDNWWTNFLYLNNFLKTDTSCMGWSWYLACDMQFYLVSPLMFVPLVFYGWNGLIVPFAFLLGTAICAGVISSKEDLLAVDAYTPALGMTPEMDDYYDNYYIKPYTRIGPFVVGVVTGFLLFKTNCKARLSKLVVTLGWIAAAAMALAVIYGPHDHIKRDDFQSTEIRALYNALQSITWGISVCWVIFACASGYGGIVNRILSWKSLIPLSKLSYCAYLVHPLVIIFYFYSQRSIFLVNNLNLTFAYVAIVALTYGVAFIAYMAYEIPMTELEKVVRGQEKRK